MRTDIKADQYFIAAEISLEPAGEVLGDDNLCELIIEEDANLGVSVFLQ